MLLLSVGAIMTIQSIDVQQSRTNMERLPVAAASLARRLRRPSTLFATDSLYQKFSGTLVKAVLTISNVKKKLADMPLGSGTSLSPGRIRLPI